MDNKNTIKPSSATPIQNTQAAPAAQKVQIGCNNGLKASNSKNWNVVSFIKSLFAWPASTMTLLEPFDYTTIKETTRADVDAEINKQIESGILGKPNATASEKQEAEDIIIKSILGIFLKEANQPEGQPLLKDSAARLLLQEITGNDNISGESKVRILQRVLAYPETPLIVPSEVKQFAAKHIREELVKSDSNGKNIARALYQIANNTNLSPALRLEILVGFAAMQKEHTTNMKSTAFTAAMGYAGDILSKETLEPASLERIVNVIQRSSKADRLDRALNKAIKQQYDKDPEAHAKIIWKNLGMDLVWTRLEENDKGISASTFGKNLTVIGKRLGYGSDGLRSAFKKLYTDKLEKNQDAIDDIRLELNEGEKKALELNQNKTDLESSITQVTIDLESAKSEKLTKESELKLIDESIEENKAETQKHSELMATEAKINNIEYSEYKTEYESAKVHYEGLKKLNDFKNEVCSLDDLLTEVIKSVDVEGKGQIEKVINNQAFNLLNDIQVAGKWFIQKQKLLNQENPEKTKLLSQLEEQINKIETGFKNFKDGSESTVKALTLQEQKEQPKGLFERAKKLGKTVADALVNTHEQQSIDEKTRKINNDVHREHIKALHSINELLNSFVNESASPEGSDELKALNARLKYLQDLKLDSYKNMTKSELSEKLTNLIDEKVNAFLTTKETVKIEQRTYPNPQVASTYRSSKTNIDILLPNDNVEALRQIGVPLDILIIEDDQALSGNANIKGNSSIFVYENGERAPLNDAKTKPIKISNNFLPFILAKNISNREDMPATTLEALASQRRRFFQLDSLKQHQEKIDKLAEELEPLNKKHDKIEQEVNTKKIEIKITERALDIKKNELVTVDQEIAKNTEAINKNTKELDAKEKMPEVTGKFADIF